MSTKSESIQLWQATDQVSIPKGVTEPDAIVAFGSETLSKRDIASIAKGFEAESYEMVSTFVWTKAAATLKRQVAMLGMEFVGEMLGRPDLDDDSDPATAIGDHEAIALAEDLGMVTTTQALRLKHSLELVAHFSKLPNRPGVQEEMDRGEAVQLLKTCITSILGKPQFAAAMQFAKFRDRLTSVTFKANDTDVAAIKASPYFFIRTTLSVLLSAIKTSQGASLEHAVGNAMTLVPILWDQIREQERWQIGQKYAEVSADGNRIASAGLKRALMDVRGFDFVPESLRSNTFTEAAATVISAHFALNNYYNEKQPMEALAALGTSIPRPALAKVLEAVLAVRLGNQWGEARSAQPAATRVLDLLRPVQWAYYFDECLRRDRTVLDKLAFEERPRQRWCELISSLEGLDDFRSRSKSVNLLLENSRKGMAPRQLAEVGLLAKALREKIAS